MKPGRAALVLLALAAGGCGDPALWARWRAESALYHARRFEQAVLASGRAAADTDLSQAERRLQDVVAAFPAAEWAERGRVPGPARDILFVSGQAAFELAVLEQQRGRDLAAAEQYARVERDYAALPGLVVKALAARAPALERAGRFDEALAAHAALATMDPMIDTDAEEPSAAIMAAPLELAARLRADHRPERADTVLALADANFTRSLERASGSGRVALTNGVSLVRAARGDAPGALAALRQAMRADLPSREPVYARLLAARALDAGAPDSVFAYARWATSLSGARSVAGQAWLVAAQAWEQLGRPDSALASYDAILFQWSDPGPAGLEARFRQAQLLERMGQWERARSTYVALAARFPSQPQAFAAQRQVVQHHLQAGQPELARIVGESALQNLQRLLDTNLDPGVQRDARAVRADLLLALGRADAAEAVLLDLWRRFPEDSLAEDAGLRAARLAARRPEGAARAESIRVALRERATNAAVRRAAAAPAGF